MDIIRIFGYNIKTKDMKKVLITAYELIQMANNKTFGISLDKKESYFQNEYSGTDYVINQNDNKITSLLCMVGFAPSHEKFSVEMKLS